MPSPYQYVTVEPRQGGDLVTQFSNENVGAANYTIKRDWRRVIDGEVRREGDVLFAPNTEGDETAQSEPGGSDAIKLIHYARRANGETALIVGTGTDLWRFFEYGDGNVYDVGDTVYDPGVYEDLSGEWLHLGSFLEGHRWEAIDVAGKTIFNNGVELPIVYDLGQLTAHPLYELREQGIATVDTIAEHGGTLFCGGVSYVEDEDLSSAEYDPYAGVDTTGYQVLWSNNGDPEDFASTIAGSMSVSSRVLTLDHPGRSFKLHDEISVIGAAENGGVLSAKIVQYLDDTRTQFKLDVKAETSVTNVSVSKTSASASISGSADLQGDSSKIVRMIELQGSLLVFKETAVFRGTATGSVDRPYNFTQIYTGVGMPFWRWMFVRRDAEIIYAGRNSFYSFDLSSQAPRKHPKLSLCQNIFFDAAGATSNMENYFVADNTVTNELWFAFPNAGVDQAIAYDYEFQTCSTIAENYTSAGTIQRPTADEDNPPEENWFVLGSPTGEVLQYALTQPNDLSSEGSTGLWTRRGDNYDSLLKSGLISFGDEFDEKDVRSYVLYQSELTPPSIEVKIYGYRNVRETASLLLTKTIATAGFKNLISLFFRKNYFQDQLRVTSSDKNARISRRLYEVALVTSKSTTRNANS